jgi:hypothetical protein
MHILDCRAEWQKPPVLDNDHTDGDENVWIADCVGVAVERSVQAHARRIINMAVVDVIATMRAFWIHLRPLRRRRLLSNNA